MFVLDLEGDLAVQYYLPAISRQYLIVVPAK